VISVAPESSSRFQTFLFSDVDGAAERWELDSAAMATAVDTLHGLFRGVMERHGGAVFKTVADACCVAFPAPESAVAAAVDAQRALRGTDLDGLQLRMAVHAGQVELRDGDYFGQAVNRVARLLSATHGGQIVVSGIVTDLVQGMLPSQVTLRDLGQHRLKDLTRPEQVYQLLAPDLPASFPPLRSLNALPHNLPQQVTSFIGRDVELREVRGLVAAHRLVTLTGSGGLGKTRIALQVGAECLTHFRDGVWLLEMAPLTESALVVEMAAALFGLTIQGGRQTIETVANYLGDKQLLLILDNCEHIVEGAAELAGAVLGSCPGVHLLVTGRQALGILGEHPYRVPSLAVPDRPEAVTAQSAMGYGAIQLFVERAEAAIGSFALGNDTAPTVAEICRRLDGIPLALELAAPRLKMLTPHGLLARLKDRFRLLTGGDRTALPRQQTLKATLEWSFNLLSTKEQTMLQRLSVFGGSWTIEAATVVASGDSIEADEVFDLVGSLIDKSLIVPVAGPSGEGRYRLLESTRQFGLERLLAGGGGERRRVCAEFLTSLFDQADLVWQNTPTEAWLARFEPELDNVRAALEWSFGDGGDPALGSRLASRTVLLLGELSLLSELRRWCETALAAMGGSIPPEIEGRLLLAHLFGADFGNRRLVAAAERAVELHRASTDRLALASALRLLAKVLASPGDIEAAERLIVEAEAMLRPLARTKELASVLSVRSVIREFGGDAVGARALAEESLALSRALGHRGGVETTAANLAELAFGQGDVAEAVRRARETLAATRRSGNLRLTAGMLGNLAGYLLRAGAIDEAERDAHESLRLARVLGWDYWVTICLEHLALVAALRGRLRIAAQILGYAEAWYRREGRVRQPTEAATRSGAASLLDAALGAEEQARLAAEGARWDETSAVAAIDALGVEAFG
jgi:predicted ATPase/class 3 adenylate cyclase